MFIIKIQRLTKTEQLKIIGFKRQILKLNGWLFLYPAFNVQGKYFSVKYLSEIQMQSKTFVHLISNFYKM